MPLTVCPRGPCPSSVRFSTEIPLQPVDGQTGEDEPNWIMVPEKPLAAWIVVPGVEMRVPEEYVGMPSPSPIRCVLLGKIHGLELGIMIGLGVAPPVAGSRMVEGTLTKVAPLFQGVVPAAHVIFVPVVPGSPRASITAPELGYVVLA